MKAILTSILLFFFFSQALSQIYVDWTNTNPSPAGTSSNPYTTINAAINAANNGDIILVRPGNYAENSGSSYYGVWINKPLIIQSVEGPLVTSISIGASILNSRYSLLSIQSNSIISGFRTLTLNSQLVDPTNPAISIKPLNSAISVTLDNMIFGNTTIALSENRWVSSISVDGTTSYMATVNVTNSKFQYVGPILTGTSPCTYTGTEYPGAVLITGTNNSVSFYSCSFDQIRCSAIQSQGGSLTVQDTAFYYIFGTAIWYTNTSSLVLENNSFFECSRSDTQATAVYCPLTVTNFVYKGNKFCGRSGSYTFSSGTRTYNSASCGANLRSKLFVDQFVPGCYCGDPSRGRDSCGTCFGNDMSCIPTTLYVNSTAPSGGNGSLISPYNSFSTALNAATYGSTVYLLPGIYDISSSLSITPVGVTVTTQYPQTVFLSCTSGAYIALTSSWGTNYNVIGTFVSSDTIFNNLYFQNCILEIQDSSPTISNSLFNGTSTGQTGLIDVSVTTNSGGSMPIFQNILVTGTCTVIPGLVHLTNYGFDYSTFTNSVFENIVGTAIALTGTGAATFTNCVFTRNSPLSSSYNGNDIRVGTASKPNYPYLTLISNSFSSSSTSDLIDCPGIYTSISLTQNNNTFCPNITIGLQCNNLINPANAPPSVRDSCGVCNGNNVELDCSGVCWGLKKQMKQGCCLIQQADCNGYCFGNSTKDINGNCCFSNLLLFNDTCYGIFTTQGIALTNQVSTFTTASQNNHNVSLASSLFFSSFLIVFITSIFFF